MKSCKIINGKLRCLEDDILNSRKGQSPLEKGQSPLGKKQSPLGKKQNPLEKGQSPLSGIDGDDGIDGIASSKTKDFLHPIIGNHITKPNTHEVPHSVREKAIMTQGSSEYFESGMNQTHLNDYLNTNNIAKKYTVDFELSTEDALVYVNNETGKATVSFRGTQPTNLTDWKENLNFATTDFKIKPLNTTYGKRVKQLYNNVVEHYDIEHITGFSKGGFGAISLGDHANIETTTFSPAVSMGHIRTSKNTRHNIWNTTEDVVSVLANPLKLKNRNVNVNTLNPLKSLDSILPHKTHTIDNYIHTDATRRISHTNRLTQEYVRASTQLKEMEAARFAQYFIDQRMTFTDYLTQVANKDVNMIDNTLSKQIQRNGLYHRTWKELGGNFTQVESEHLTRSVESVEKPISTRTERADYAQLPDHMRAKQRNILEQEKVQIGNQIEQLNTDHTEILSKVGASHFARGGVTMMLGGAVGNAAGFILNDEELMLGKLPMIGDEIAKDLKSVKEAVEPVTEYIPDKAKEYANPFFTAGTMASLTGGSIALEGTAGVLAYEADKYVGEGAKYLASRATDNEDIQKHVQTVTEGAAAPSLFFKSLQGLAYGLRAAAGVEAVVPVPGARLMAGLSLLGAAIAEAV